MFFYTSLQSPLFAHDPLCFAITHRLNGVSDAPFSSLNLGYHVGDNSESVDENHRRVKRRFSEVFNTKTSALHYLSQVHGTQSIFLEDLPPVRLKSQNQSVCIGEADGIITHTLYQSCLVMVADCNPILLYDRIRRVMAVIHAGRKGVLDGIVLGTFQSMCDKYGSRAEDCLVYVGPSIRGCCYEVGEAVKREVVDRGFAGALQGVKLDLISCLRSQLRYLGIHSEHIEIDPHCTHCSKYLYSYRREGQTGRFGLIAMLMI